MFVETHENQQILKTPQFICYKLGNGQTNQNKWTGVIFLWQSQVPVQFLAKQIAEQTLVSEPLLVKTRMSRARDGPYPGTPEAKKTRMDSADLQLDVLKALQSIMDKITPDQMSARQAGVAAHLKRDSLPPTSTMTKELLDLELQIRTGSIPAKWTLPEKAACLRALREEQDPTMVRDKPEKNSKILTRKSELVEEVVKQGLISEEEVNVLKLSAGDLRLLLRSSTDPEAKKVFDKTIQLKVAPSATENRSISRETG